MIFIRHKPYNYTPNRRNRSNRHQRRPTHSSRPTNLIENSTLSNSRRLARSTSSVLLVRSKTLNERLASIGGLFGALSIITTAALLYAIFTAKTEDKWYYIIAVLVNISILVALMLAAILFDRLYIKKYTNRRQLSPYNQSNRILNINPNLCNNISTHPGLLSNLNYLLRNDNNNNRSLDYINIRSYNDIPPEYPGYLEGNNNLISNNTPANEINKNSNKITSQISTISNEINHQMISANGQQNNLINSFAISNLPNEVKQIAPPGYYDLYPKEGKTSIPKNT